jgi:peptide/nickel transport system ATP-binding protein
VSGQVDVVKELPIKGEIPSAADIPPGCRFHPRCIFATRACSELAEPELEPVGEGHQVACRRWREM